MVRSILPELVFQGLFGQCWDQRQTVNLVSAGGLVEQSNAAKNNAVDKLAGLLLLVAVWPAGGSLTGWLAGWPAAGLLQLLLLPGSVVDLLCYGCSLAGSLPGCVRSLAVCWLATVEWLADAG